MNWQKNKGERVKQLFPSEKNDKRTPPRKDNRTMLNGDVLDRPKLLRFFKPDIVSGDTFSTFAVFSVSRLSILQLA